MATLVLIIQTAMSDKVAAQVTSESFIFLNEHPLLEKNFSNVKTTKNVFFNEFNE